MALTFEQFMAQLGNLFSGGQSASQAPSMTELTYPTPENTNLATWQPPGAESSSGLGLNLGTAGLALGGLNALSGLLQGNRAMGLAEDQFKFAKNLARTNLTNQTKSYNTALEDRLTARGVTMGSDPAAVAAEIERKRLNG